MFLLGLIIGLIVGASFSLFLYACIIAGKESDVQSGYRKWIK